jgi:hypothetical protein
MHSDPAEETRPIRRARPWRRGSFERDRDAAGTSRDALGADEHGDSLAPFDDASDAHPRGVRKLAYRRRRHIGQVERDDAEASRLENEIHRFQSASGIAGIAHPEQAREIESRPGRGRRIEPIARIDERDRLSALGGSGENPAEDCRPARRSRADDFREVATRKPAAKRRIKTRDAGRSPITRLPRPRGRGRQRDVEFASPEERFDFSARRHCFAFCSPVSGEYSGAGRRDQGGPGPSA